MLNTKSLFACTLLIPLLGATIPAQAQVQKETQTQGQAVKRDAAETAKRTKCFEEANAAAAKVGSSGGQNAERNAVGSDAYHECAMKEGIRP